MAEDNRTCDRFVSFYGAMHITPLGMQMQMKNNP
jgi:hypothetical protein